MKTVIPISKNNNTADHICNCDSHDASSISGKVESSGGCGCGGSHSHEGHSHDGHICNHEGHEGHHHAEGHVCNHEDGHVCNHN